MAKEYGLARGQMRSVRDCESETERQRDNFSSMEMTTPAMRCLNS